MQLLTNSKLTIPDAIALTAAVFTINGNATEVTGGSLYVDTITQTSGACDDQMWREMFLDGGPAATASMGFLANVCDRVAFVTADVYSTGGNFFQDNPNVGERYWIIAGSNFDGDMSSNAPLFVGGIDEIMIIDSCLIGMSNTRGNIRFRGFSPTLSDFLSYEVQYSSNPSGARGHFHETNGNAQGNFYIIGGIVEVLNGAANAAVEWQDDDSGGAPDFADITMTDMDLRVTTADARSAYASHLETGAGAADLPAVITVTGGVLQGDSDTPTACTQGPVHSKVAE